MGRKTKLQTNQINSGSSTPSCPVICPACSGKLIIRELACQNCETEVTGEFDQPLLSKLSDEDQKFIIDFIKLNGSLKNMSKHLGMSYPTVRNKLDEIIDTLKTEDSSP